MNKFRKYIILGISVPLILFITIYVSLALFISDQAEKDTKVQSDVIIVLGARSYIGDTYNPCLVSRMDHAAALYRAGYGSKVLVSGGNDKEDNVNEAETMKKIAIEKGVKEEDILMEKKATSTYENLSLSQEIMKQHNLNSAIIVTEPFHIARASLVADTLGYNFTVSPAKKNSCWLPNKYLTKYFLKEPLAILQYKLRNRF